MAITMIDLFNEYPETDFNVKKAKVSSKSCQQKYDNLLFEVKIDSGLFDECAECFRERNVSYEIRDEDKLCKVAGKINDKKYNNLDFEWIDIQLNENHQVRSIEEDIVSDEGKSYLYHFLCNEELIVSDYFYRIDNSESYLFDSNMIERWKGYADKGVFFFKRVDEKLLFQGYGKFNFRQSLCEKRMVFNRVIE